MTDPVICMDGITYERRSIMWWMITNDTSPITGMPLQSKHLVPNTALRAVIAKFQS